LLTLASFALRWLEFMRLPDYTDQGTGDMVVFLLHGVGGSSAGWERTAPALAGAGYRSIAWNMPGYGQSPVVTPYTMQTLAESLLQLIAHIGAKRNVLLGHSMGGMVAQQALAMRPDAIDAAILFATSSAFAPPAKPGEPAQASMQWQQAFLSSRLAPLDAGLGMASLAAQLVSGMFAPGTPNKTALFQATEMMANVPEATYRLALAAIAEFDQRENLPRIAVPLLCLAAELDKNAPPRVLEKMAAQAVNSNDASYACIEAAGHLANMEKPDAFNACVLSFLQKHFPTDHRN
jgi:3-oxoadipate enol-lactonase